MLPDSLAPPIRKVFEAQHLAPSAFARPVWLEEPPPAHRYLHELCPVALVIDAFRQILAQPVQIGSNRNGRFATVLGAYLFHLEEDGRLLGWRWTPNGPTPIDEHHLALQHLVSERDWLEQNSRLLGTLLFKSVVQTPRPAVATQPAPTPVPPTTRAYAKWLIDEIAQVLLTAAAIEQTQQSVLHTLSINGELLEKATSLPARVADRHSVSIGDYNLMLIHASKIEQIKKDSPLIANLYPLFCDAADFAQDVEPAAALKQFLLENGVDQATWRALCAMGIEPLKPLLGLYEGSRDKAMLDLLKCLCVLQIRRASQLWAVAHLFSTYGAHRSRPLQYLNSIEGDPVLVHILACSPQTLRPNQQETDELDLVIRWAMDEHIGQPDKRQRQAGWSWLIRQATHWRTREHIRLQATTGQWPAPVQAVSIEQLTFEALQTELALWDEALALHHCADVYGHRCRAGAYLIYSVRRPGVQAGKRVATLALSRLGPRWTVDQLVGPANTGVTPAVEQAALILVDLLNQLPATESKRQKESQNMPARSTDKH